MAKELAMISKPLVGMSSCHVFNTKNFMQHLKGIKVQQDECIISYDMKALFTSMPTVPAINTIKDKLSKHRDLQQRNIQGNPSYHHPVGVLLEEHIFVFQGRYYEQLEDAAMGSTIFPIVASLYMEEFETKALNTSPHPKSLEKIYG